MVHTQSFGQEASNPVQTVGMWILLGQVKGVMYFLATVQFVGMTTQKDKDENGVFTAAINKEDGADKKSEPTNDM